MNCKYYDQQWGYLRLSQENYEMRTMLKNTELFMKDKGKPRKDSNRKYISSTERKYMKFEILILMVLLRILISIVNDCVPLAEKVMLDRNGYIGEEGNIYSRKMMTFGFISTVNAESLSSYYEIDDSLKNVLHELDLIDHQMRTDNDEEIDQRRLSGKSRTSSHLRNIVLNDEEMFYNSSSLQKALTKPLTEDAHVFRAFEPLEGFSNKKKTHYRQLMIKIRYDDKKKMISSNSSSQDKTQDLLFEVQLLNNEGQEVVKNVVEIEERRGLMVTLNGNCPSVRPISELDPRWDLDTSFYAKFVQAAGGVPFLGSNKVSDGAIIRAAMVFNDMVKNLPREVPEYMADIKTRIAVMASSEVTTDVPEHRHLREDQQTDWDTRARGLGANCFTKTGSVAEENVLCWRSDSYWGDRIDVHEISHAIHEMGIQQVYPEFFLETVRQWCRRNDRVYRDFRDYASRTWNEFFAQSSQSMYNSNPSPWPQGNENFPDQFNRKNLKNQNSCMHDLLEMVYGKKDPLDEFRCQGNGFPDGSGFVDCSDFWRGSSPRGSKPYNDGKEVQCRTVRTDCDANVFKHVPRGTCLGVNSVTQKGVYDVVVTGNSSPFPDDTNPPTSNIPPISSPSFPPTFPPTHPPTSRSPTPLPTNPPTQSPTLPPTQSPTMPPTKSPTIPSTQSPTMPPTQSPTNVRTESPSKETTQKPTMQPTSKPSVGNPTVPGSTPSPTIPSQEHRFVESFTLARKCQAETIDDSDMKQYVCLALQKFIFDSSTSNCDASLVKVEQLDYDQSEHSEDKVSIQVTYLLQGDVNKFQDWKFEEHQSEVETNIEKQMGCERSETSPNSQQSNYQMLTTVVIGGASAIAFFLALAFLSITLTRQRNKSRFSNQYREKNSKRRKPPGPRTKFANSAVPYVDGNGRVFASELSVYTSHPSQSMSIVPHVHQLQRTGSSDYSPVSRDETPWQG